MRNELRREPSQKGFTIPYEGLYVNYTVSQLARVLEVKEHVMVKNGGKLILHQLPVLELCGELLPQDRE